MMSRLQGSLGPILRGQIYSTQIVAHNFHSRRNKLWKVIIEEPKQYKNVELERHHAKISDFLHDSQLPLKRKRKLIISTLQEVIALPSDKEQVELINFVLREFKNLQRKHNSSTNIPIDILSHTFRRLYPDIEKNHSEIYDELVTELLRHYNKLSNETLILLIDLLSQRNIDTEYIFQSLGTRLNENFTKEYFSMMERRQKLKLNVFEVMIKFGIRDSYITALNNYIEKLFEDETPEVHCYKDLERHLDRIHMLISNVIDTVDFEKISIRSLLTLLRLNDELSQVNNFKGSSKRTNTLLDSLYQRFDNLQQVLQKPNNSIDATLLETLLYKARECNKPLFSKVLDILKHTKLQSNSYLIEEATILNLINGESKNENHRDCETDSEDVSQISDELYQKLESCSSETFTKVVPIIAKISPQTVSSLLKLYNSRGIAPSAEFYKALLDNAIKRDDHKAALKIFEDAKLDVDWLEDANDPSVAKTLNELIQCVMEALPINESFRIFRTVKTALPLQISADTINAIAVKLLESNYVGDCMTLMKRELPEIEDEKLRLPIDKPYGYKYMNLFNTVHEYVISNKSDKTVNNNWFLYKDLYKYFHVPVDRILPTMKFFCDNNRWHGALLIFNKMVEQSQIHGKHSFEPPTKEIYTYLLEEFGNSLYEEGVVEVHEWLKMDTNIQEQGLELSNIIMNAYCNLQDTPKVRDLFLSTSVNQGVNEESAVIMLKAYTYNDLNYVDKFWNNLSTFGLVPEYSLFRQYLIAQAYHGKVDKAFALLEEAQDYDVEVNEDLLLSMHNYCYMEEPQAEIKRLAAVQYPQIWQNVEQSGLLLETKGYRPTESFLIDGSTTNERRLPLAEEARHFTPEQAAADPVLPSESRQKIH